MQEGATAAGGTPIKVTLTRTTWRDLFSRLRLLLSLPKVQLSRLLNLLSLFRKARPTPAFDNGRPQVGEHKYPLLSQMTLWRVTVTFIQQGCTPPSTTSPVKPMSLQVHCSSLSMGAQASAPEIVHMQGCSRDHKCFD
jgi:hypothetical protein